MNRVFFKNEASAAIATQSVCVIACSVIVLMFCGWREMASFFMGGVICVLPNIYLYRRVFSHFGARAAKQIFRSLYYGEFVKMVLTGACFVGAALSHWVLPLYLFMGYIAAQLGFWLAPIIVNIIPSREYPRKYGFRINHDGKIHGVR